MGGLSGLSGLSGNSGLIGSAGAGGSNPFEAAGATNLWAAEQLGGYTGPIARIKNLVSNAEQDFDSLSAATSWLGVDSGQVLTLYDQIGDNDLNFDPVIYTQYGDAPNNLLVATTFGANAKPAFSLSHSGGTNATQYKAANAFQQNDVSICFVLQPTNPSNGGALLKTTNCSYSVSNSNYNTNHSGAAQFISHTGVNQPHLLVCRNGSTNRYIKCNGVDAVGSPVTRGIEDFFLFNSSAVSPYYPVFFIGKFASLVIGGFDSIEIESLLNSHYGVY